MSVIDPSEVVRVDAELVGGERAMLEQWLDYHRATLLMKCAGLDAEQLRRRSCPPSTLSLLGLVRHMTDVERGWFLRGVAGRPRTEVPPLYYDDDNPDGDFDDVDDADPDAVFATYRQTLDEIRAATAGADLEGSSVRGDERISFRWIYLHMLEEYARHNGHADLLRQAIDGATGE
jgi:Protein of unknown function (DUF664)